MSYREGVRCWVYEDVDTDRADYGQPYLYPRERLLKQGKGEQGRKQGKGVEEHHGVGQRNHGNAFK